MKLKKSTAGSAKIGKLNKPPAQGKSGPFTTPFTNRIMKMGKGR